MKTNRFFILSWFAAAAAFTLSGTNAADTAKPTTGLQLYSLRAQAAEHGVPWVLDKAKVWGIKEVEIAGMGDFSPAQMKEEVDKRGLKAISSHFPYKRLKEDPAGVVKDAKALDLKYAGCAWIDHKDAFDEAECRDAIATFNKVGEMLA